jgi:hypothetical protein
MSELNFPTKLIRLIKTTLTIMMSCVKIKNDCSKPFKTRNDTTIRDVGQSVATGDKHFEVVKEIVYLGSLMTPKNDVSLEIQRRIQTANRCFFGLVFGI